MKWTGPGLALLAALALGAAPASAATPYTVSSTVDQTSGGSCVGTVCTSLRAAVTNVPAGSTIQLATGIYKLSGFLAVGTSLSIVGVSPAQTTIQQTKTGDGVIEASAGDLSLSQLTITGGTKQGVDGQDQAAGGIYTAGTSLSLSHVSVTGNTATGSRAPGATGGEAIGAIQIDGFSTTLTIAASSITHNSGTGGKGADAVGSGDGKNGGTAYGAIADFAQTAPSISNSVISNNTATGGTGGTGSGLPGYSGGLSGQADGAMTFIPKTAASTTLILGTTIANNTSIGGQGGKGINPARGGNGNTVFAALSNGNNTLKLISSTVSGNIGTASTGGTGSPNGNPGTVIGGGLDAESGNLTLINSTVSGNVISGDSEGGGIDMRSSTGKLTLGNDTIFGNSAQQGGNIDAISTQMTLAGTIIAGGVAGPTYSTTANCNLDTVNLIDLGHNLENTKPTRCDLSGTDLVGVNPQLASLAGNGGLTQTMALGPASPALSAGGACTDISLSGSVPLGVDQRGLPRAAACDIGAFQHQPVAEQAAPAITGSATFASTLTCSPGTWSGDGLSYQYEWSRGGRAIPGATGSTLLVTASDFSTPLSCAVTATGTYGTGTASTSVTMPASCNCTPRITKLSQSHRTWRRGGRLAHLSAIAKRPPVGTTFTFTLDRAATVVLSFTRTSNGRVVHHRCVPLTRANRRDRACTITKADGSMTFKARAGVSTVSFQGRLSKTKRLATGNYLLGVAAAVTGGPTSKPSTLRFSVVS